MVLIDAGQLNVVLQPLHMTNLLHAYWLVSLDHRLLQCSVYYLKFLASDGKWAVG